MLETLKQDFLRLPEVLAMPLDDADETAGLEARDEPSAESAPAPPAPAPAPAPSAPDAHVPPAPAPFGAGPAEQLGLF
jgi:hypothetical protein